MKVCLVRESFKNGMTVDELVKLWCAANLKFWVNEGDEEFWKEILSAGLDKYFIDAEKPVIVEDMPPPEEDQQIDGDNLISTDGKDIGNAGQ